eukprot:4686589-Prymnesium_polylepis.1
MRRGRAGSSRWQRACTPQRVCPLRFESLRRAYAAALARFESRRRAYAKRRELVKAGGARSGDEGAAQQRADRLRELADKLVAPKGGGDRRDARGVAAVAARQVGERRLLDRKEGADLAARRRDDAD